MSGWQLEVVIMKDMLMKKYKTKCVHCGIRLYVDVRIREEHLKISCNDCYMRINNLDGITCTLLSDIKHAPLKDVMRKLRKN